MALTHRFTSCPSSKKNSISKDEQIIALAGNPNVGKSTIFNELTGMNQHTGNWPGKTVSLAKGSMHYEDKTYTFVDLPGTYSLIASSSEETIASDFICFDHPHATLIVCDATALQRNLNLVLQILQMTSNAVVCVNLMDEAKKKKIEIDLDKLSFELGVTVLGSSARSGTGLDQLVSQLALVCKEQQSRFYPLHYPFVLQSQLDRLLDQLTLCNHSLSSPWLALQLLSNPEKTCNQLVSQSILAQSDVETLHSLALRSQQILNQTYQTSSTWQDLIIATHIEKAEEITNRCVVMNQKEAFQRDQKIDRLLSSTWTSIPLMLALLSVILWITLTGANIPSQWLATILFSLETPFANLLTFLNLPSGLVLMLSEGMYRVLAWVIAVMLPPMAIFFPLFTYLEDLGYLPRIAFNLDKYFCKAHACGKQALTMCMGFGCNAAGVVGCRIIDSPREQLIAILTNSFIPCNGRFPTLISIITMFFLGTAVGLLQTIQSTLLLTLAILFGILMTFLMSQILSKTLLKGSPSSFTLELPPYRRPQLAKVLVRSILDRTLFVLGRAMTVAAPAGILIWILANVYAGNQSILSLIASTLDPLGQLMGLDGIILLAFILGFPANEIVIPIVIMAYLSNGSLSEMSNLPAMHQLLVSQGWTMTTALCTLIFVLFHWPCSTTCITIFKETKSIKWTVYAILIPTFCGFLCCSFIATLSRLFSL